MATYSSKGPSMVDHIVKPDLVAPGNRITAASASGSALSQLYPQNMVGNHYMRVSGTSLAAPVVTGAAAVGNVALNLVLIPPYGMMGAAVATIAAFATMFVGMAWWSQRIYPVPYQWRRVVTAAAVGIAIVVAGKLADVNLVVALALALAYPLALALFGFYLPAERKAIGARLRPAR